MLHLFFDEHKIRHIKVGGVNNIDSNNIRNNYTILVLLLKTTLLKTNAKHSIHAVTPKRCFVHFL